MRQPASYLHAVRPPLARQIALVLIIGAVATWLTVPPSAGAVPTLSLAPGYGASTITCEYHGQTDETGVLYTTCGSKIARYDKQGVRLADITIPAGAYGSGVPMDVAPSPDGRYLYLSQGVNPPKRLNRQANGSYTLDAAWKLATFPYGGKQYAPIGHLLQTDGRGDIYVSNGSYWISNKVATPGTIVKYAPGGTYLTQFGDYGTQDGNFISNQDVSVSRDGRRVYIGENCGPSCTWGDPQYQGSRVTRYDYVPGGTYRFTRVISARGAMDGNPFPLCTSAGAIHSGYSLSMDAWENLYVTSTSCGRIQMFATGANPADDTFVKSVAWYLDGTTPVRQHNVTSDWAGRLYVPQWKRVLVPDAPKLPAVPLPALAPLPKPDIEAPVVASIAMPQATATPEVEIAIDAADDVAVTEMRLANEDGAWGPWQPFATPVMHRLTEGYSVKGVSVQVRDMAGNQSAAVYRTVRYEEAAAGGGAPVDGGAPAAPAPGAALDVADPVLSTLTVPPLTSTREVTVSVEATDDVAVQQVRYANEDGNWAAWQPFAAAGSWTLSDGYTSKVVFAQVRDAAGRESAVLSARTRLTADAPLAGGGAGEGDGGGGAALDVTAPVLSSIAMPAETTEQAVTIAIDAFDEIGVAQVRFANEDGNWTAWQPFAAQRQWALSAGFGGKLVFAQVRDTAGNESLTVTERTSHVKSVAGPADVAAPTLLTVGLADVVRASQVTLQLEATDDVGVSEVRVANEDGNWGAWQPFQTDLPHTLTAGFTYKAVYVQVRDAAGQESNMLFARTVVQP